jgi:hypothetical protein
MCGIRWRLPVVRRSAVGGSVADRQIAEVTASLLALFRLGTVSLRRAVWRRDSGAVAGRQIAELATASLRASVFL